MDWVVCSYLSAFLAEGHRPTCSWEPMGQLGKQNLPSGIPMPLLSKDYLTSDVRKLQGLYPRHQTSSFLPSRERFYSFIRAGQPFCTMCPQNANISLWPTATRWTMKIWSRTKTLGLFTDRSRVLSHSCYGRQLGWAYSGVCNPKSCPATATPVSGGCCHCHGDHNAWKP